MGPFQRAIAALRYADNSVGKRWGMRKELGLPGSLDHHHHVCVRESRVLPAPAEENAVSARNDMNKLVRALEREGFIATRTAKNHIRFRHPAFSGCVIAASTPSDHRSVKNLQACLKRKLRAANDN